MVMVEILIMLVAVLCAPPMIYGIWAGRQRAHGVAVPSFGAMLAAAWAMLAPSLSIAGYVARRALAPARDHGAPPWEHFTHMSSAEDAAHEKTAETGSVCGLSDLSTALESRALDRTRAALIEAMVIHEWPVGGVRALLKGDNGAIGAEIDAARARLGISAPSRIVTVGKDRHEVKL